MVSVVASFTGWHGWSWQGWAALVAIGTLFLAMATVVLAWMTRGVVTEAREQIKVSAREVTAVERQAKAMTDQTTAVREQAEATQRQAAISAAALEASVRPVLVGVTPGYDLNREDLTYMGGATYSVEQGRVHYDEVDDILFCSVPFKNVGPGVAFVQRVSLLTRTPYDGRVSNAVIPPNGISRALFTIRLLDNNQQRTDANEITKSSRGFALISFYIVYTAASHNLVMASNITYSQLPNESFIVTANEILDGETGTPKRLAATPNI